MSKQEVDNTKSICKYRYALCKACLKTDKKMFDFYHFHLNYKRHNKNLINQGISYRKCGLKIN